MAGEIKTGADALVMDDKDHVATALKDLKAGESVTYRNGLEVFSLTLVDAVPFGHKIAITEIAEGSDVRKYGEVIGRASVAIQVGQHVHVHNVEGIRGRGDQVKGAAK